MRMLNPKLQELRKRAAAINYSSVSVNELGDLKDRESLLDQRIVEGYGVIWGKRNLHQEIFLRGAFAKSIRENGPGSGSNYEIKFLRNHDVDQPLSLFEVLKEDEIGLYFKTKPLDPVEWADNTLAQLKTRTLNNFSQGFNYIWDNGKMEYDEATDSLIVKEAVLLELSVATIPSGMDTYCVRTAEALEGLQDNTEDFIERLPRKYRLEARQIFAQHQSLLLAEPLERRALNEEKPRPNRGIDYNYLINNFKL